MREKQNLIKVVQSRPFHPNCGIPRRQGDSSRPTTYNTRYVLLKHRDAKAAQPIPLQ